MEQFVPVCTLEHVCLAFHPSVEDTIRTPVLFICGSWSQIPLVIYLLIQNLAFVVRRLITANDRDDSFANKNTNRDHCQELITRYQTWGLNLKRKKILNVRFSKSCHSKETRADGF